MQLPRRRRDGTLATFLQELALETADDPDDAEPGERNAVMLMTLHSAKGLESSARLPRGLEEGLLPHARSIADDTIEEERRLAYVGMTRARRSLTLCHTKTRAKYGRRAESVPSRFLFEARGEIPPAPAAPAKRKGKGRGAKRIPARKRRARR